MKHLSRLSLAMLLATSLVACDKDGEESSEEHSEHAEHAEHGEGESTTTTTTSTTGTDSGGTTSTETGGTTDGGSTTSGDTGETGATTGGTESGGTESGGTGTTGGDLCGAAADDDACTTCTKQNCCDQSIACAIDATCRCGLECTAKGQSPEQCAQECMGFDPAADPYGALATCVVTNCAVACLGG